MNHYQLGYLFGKALCEKNYDPEYYAYRILPGQSMTIAEERQVYAGAKQAVLEMPVEVRAKNLHDLVTSIKPWPETVEWDAFTNGVEAPLTTYLGIEHPQGEGSQEFERGLVVGHWIRYVWNTAYNQAAKQL